MLFNMNCLALSVYNVNGDMDTSGKSIIDIRDLVCAKKLAIQGNSTYNADFLTELTRILLGLAELPNENGENMGGIGDIYLPEAP